MSHIFPVATTNTLQVSDWTYGPTTSASPPFQTGQPLQRACQITGHVVDGVTEGVAGVPHGSCRTCGERVLVKTLSLSAYLGRLKHLMSQVVSSGECEKDMLVEVEGELLASMVELDEMRREMGFLVDLCDSLSEG